MDVLAANAMASALAPTILTPRMNLVRATFFHPEVRSLRGDWEAIARGVVARLRGLVGIAVAAGPQAATRLAGYCHCRTGRSLRQDDARGRPSGRVWMRAPAPLVLPWDAAGAIRGSPAAHRLWNRLLRAGLEGPPPSGRWVVLPLVVEYLVVDYLVVSQIADTRNS
jgi:hypothetical protein